jgi:hypothetical protein
VNEARKRKNRRLKQAKEEAQAEIEKYKQEREITFRWVWKLCSPLPPSGVGCGRRHFLPDSTVTTYTELTNEVNSQQFTL